MWQSRRYLLFQRQQWKHQKNVWNLFKVNKNDVNDALLASLLLTLNRFHTLRCYFHCWLWTSKCQLGNVALNEFRISQKHMLCRTLFSEVFFEVFKIFFCCSFFSKSASYGLIYRIYLHLKCSSKVNSFMYVD